jgi:hypothetical protein
MELTKKQNCQNYTRALSQSLTTTTLSALVPPTKLILIGHGSPSLIPMYISSTSCPFSIFADPSPSKAIYKELAMGRTLDMGKRPGYQRTGNAWNMLSSLGQGLRELGKGLLGSGGKGALGGVDFWWVGGEMVFERTDGGVGGKKDGGEGRGLEQREVTWCHRMRNTRDHVEVGVLMDVLGVPHSEEEANGGRRMTLERKGTGLSMLGREKDGVAVAVAEHAVGNGHVEV